ncbi:MAG: hypothetical protein JSR41_10980 [Proteobacteria bacterium]|nr:hypothetical protein [Pseudomonadota bacterium]
MKAQDMLPDDQDQVRLGDTTVRKGSVGAFLANARALADATQDAATRAEAHADLLALVPPLRALGLFDVLRPRDPALQALVDSVP